MLGTSVVIRLTVTLQRVVLKVRFPCAVSCALRLEGKEREISGEWQLRNGEAQLSATHTVQFHSTEWPEKKPALLVYLKSSSGRIPAGQVLLPALKLDAQPTREMARIEKCPDKHATLEYEARLEKVGEGEGKQYPGKFNRTVSPELPLSRTPSQLYLRQSQIEPSLNSRETLLIRRGSNRDPTLLGDYYLTEKQRSSDQDKLYHLERELEQQRTRANQTEAELQVKTSRLADAEKEQRQLTKKTEQLELDFRAVGSKMECLQKANRDLTAQLRQCKEKLQEMQQSAQNAVKRGEIRESSGREQSRLLAEKLQQCESEKQRLVFEKNLSADQFEEREKKLREGFKQREKSLMEERAAVLRRADAQGKEIQAAAEQLAEMKNKVAEYNQNCNELKLLVQQLESQKQRLRLQTSDLRYQLTKCRNDKKILQQNQQATTRFAEERRQFRRQLSERDLELAQLRERTATAQTALARAKTALEETDKTHREKTNQLKQLEREVALLSKESKMAANDLADRESRLQTYLDELQHHAKRIKQLEGRLQTAQDQLEEERDAHERTNSESNMRTLHLEEEIDKLNQELFAQSQQILSLERGGEEWEAAVEEREQMVRDLESQLIQLNEANQQFQMEKLELAEEKREVQEEMAAKLEAAQESARQMESQITDTIRSFREQLEQTNKNDENMQSQILQLSSTLRQRESNIQQLERTLKQNQRQQQQCQLENQRLTQKLSILEKQHSQNERLQEDLQRQLEDKEVVALSLRTQVSNLEFECSRVADMGTAETQREVGRIRDQWEKSLKAALQQVGNIQLVQIVIPDEEMGRLLARVLSGVLAREKRLRELQNELQTQQQLRQSTMVSSQQVAVRQQQIRAQRQQIFTLKQTLQQQTQQLKSTFTDFLQTQTKLRNVEKDRKTLETDRTRLTQTESSLRQEIERGNQLEQLKLTAQRELKQEKEAVRKLMRELQNKCFELETLQATHEEMEKTLRGREADARRGKTVAAELKGILEGLVSEEIGGDGTRFERILTQIDNKELQPLKERLRTFWHTLTSLSEHNRHIEEQLLSLTAQAEVIRSEREKALREAVKLSVELRSQKGNEELQQEREEAAARFAECDRERMIARKEVEELRGQLQEAVRGREREAELVKQVEELRGSLEGCKKAVEELNKQLNTLEKQKKVSIFVISPVKQLVRKVEDGLIALLKSVTLTISRHRREVEVSATRIKKMA